MTLQALTHPSFKWVAPAALCWGLAACGGGGSDAPAVSVATGGTPSDAVAPLPAPVAAAAPAAVPSVPAASAPAPAPAPVAGADASCGLNGAAGIQAEVLQRLNALRASGAVCGTTGYAATTALAWNTTLLAAVKGHSTDMAQKNYFSHTSQDGRSAGQRVTAAGYNWSTVGETSLVARGR